MLHLTKLAVGIRDIQHLRAAQAERVLVQPPLRHLTRNMPRRRAEILGEGGAAVGSIYWVIAGTMLARQRLLDIVEDTWGDGTRCTALMLDPGVVQVEGRPMKPFQGWRYLEAANAPADVDLNAPPESMPPALRAELRSLGLI